MKRVLTIIFILLLVGMSAALVLANLPQTLPDSDTQTMRVADQLYASGQYAQAAQMYRPLAERGTANATLNYNLGTAYLQSGDLGSAILYLRRAQSLAPRDTDIESHLALARSQLTCAQWEAAWQRGYSMPLDQAAGYALLEHGDAG